VSSLTLGSVVLVAAIPHPAGVPPLYAAGIARQQASQLLTWFATHTTRLGTLPEKVDARGQPVSAAPLAWTDAAVLLTLVAQAHRLPVVPIPAG